MAKKNSQIKDLTGKRFGRLVAKSRIEGKGGVPSRWNCICDCGNNCIVRTGNLTSNSTQSCGCLQRDIARERMSKYDGVKCSKEKCNKPAHCNGLCLKHSNEQYHKKNRRHLCNRARERRIARKLDTMSHYSGGGKPKCNHCGIDDPRALVIDHVNDDGADHREMISGKRRNCGGGDATYLWLEQNNYPNGFQVLCANCNAVKEHNRKLREFNYG